MSETDPTAGEHPADYDLARREVFYAWHPLILDRAAKHGCLDEDVATGDPVACGECVTPPLRATRQARHDPAHRLIHHRTFNTLKAGRNA